MKREFWLIILSLVGFLLVSCDSDKNKVLRVGISPNLKPFIYLDQDKKVRGLDLNLIKGFCLKYGYKPVYIQDNIPNLLKGLKAEKYDCVISALSKTEDRNQIFSLSMPYYNANQAVVSLKENIIPVQNIEEIAGHKIGVLIASSGQYYIEKLLMENQSVKPDQIIKANDYPELLKLLQDKKVELVLMDKTLADIFQNEYQLAQAMTIETGEDFVVLMPENSKLKNKMNKYLKKLLKTDNYLKLLKEHFAL